MQQSHCSTSRTEDLAYLMVSAAYIYGKHIEIATKASKPALKNKIQIYQQKFNTITVERSTTATEMSKISTPCLNDTIFIY